MIDNDNVLTPHDSGIIKIETKTVAINQDKINKITFNHWALVI